MSADDLPSLALSMTSVAARTLAGLVLVKAAMGKLRSWGLLEGVIQNYRILPEPLVRPTAIALPPVELALGAALLVRPGLAGLACAGALLVAFALAMAVNVLRGRTEIDCGCFQSDLRQPLGWSLVIRNLLLAATLIASAFAGAETAGLWIWAPGTFAGVVLLVLYDAADSLLATGPRLRRWAYAEEASP